MNIGLWMINWHNPTSVLNANYFPFSPLHWARWSEVEIMNESTPSKDQTSHTALEIKIVQYRSVFHLNCLENLQFLPFNNFYMILLSYYTISDGRRIHLQELYDAIFKLDVDWLCNKFRNKIWLGNGLKLFLCSWLLFELLTIDFLCLNSNSYRFNL